MKYFFLGSLLFASCFWLPHAVHVQSAPSSVIDVRDFGARCDGLADDTVALRAAIAAADTAPFRSLYLPPSQCAFSDTLTFGGRTDRYSSVNVIGQSEYWSNLNYRGPMTKPAILISHMAAFVWRGISISSSQGVDPSFRGSAVGIQLGATVGGGGTQNTTITFDHILVQGFHIGMLIGSGDAASEVDCRQCQFSYNDIGVTPSGYNSLNLWFYGLSIGQNIVGVQLGGPWVSEGVHVIGGDSAANLTADFYAGNTFDVLSIQNFRAEITPQAQFFTGVAPHILSIRDSALIGQSYTSNVLTWRQGSFLTIDSCDVTGTITVSEPNIVTGVRISNSFIMPGTGPTWPLFLPTTSIKLNLTNNAPFGAGRYPDFVGMAP